MDPFSDAGELYTIRNQFFTNQHHKVVSYSLEQFSPENQLKVLEYQVRSQIALGEDASKLIDLGRQKFPESEEFVQLLMAYNDLKLFGVDESPYFQGVAEPKFELQAVLTALYKVKFENDIDGAISLLSGYIDTHSYGELEPFLSLVQLYLVKGNFQAANQIFNSFKNFPSSARDNIVYHVLESWILSIKGESDNISNAYYFYDELLSADFDDDEQGKFRLLSVLFVLTVQLKHYPEAQELLNQLKELNIESSDGDFIANQITFDYLTNDGANVTQLYEQLKAIDPHHQMVIDYEEKQSLFDKIVAKYEVEA